MSGYVQRGTSGGTENIYTQFIGVANESECCPKSTSKVGELFTQFSNFPCAGIMGG